VHGVVLFFVCLFFWAEGFRTRGKWKRVMVGGQGAELKDRKKHNSVPDMM